MVIHWLMMIFPMQTGSNLGFYQLYLLSTPIWDTVKMICPRLRATGDKSYSSELVKLAEANDGTEVARPMAVADGSGHLDRTTRVFPCFSSQRTLGKAAPPLLGLGVFGFFLRAPPSAGKDPLSEEACCEIAMGFRSQRASIRKDGMEGKLLTAAMVKVLIGWMHDAVFCDSYIYYNIYII